MGGCVSSRPEFPNSVHPNVFTVYPVTRPASADAIETSSISGTTNIGSKNNATGQLEVTANELILHRRGHEPVRWPLQYVRRYGYENHLFSFESGRRCESGPGIFTFRCRRAHELFLLVQANVQEARSPPPTTSGLAPPQHGVSLDNAVATLERARSGSMPSQFRFPGARGRGEQAVNIRAEERGTPRLMERTARACSVETKENLAPSVQHEPNSPAVQHNFTAAIQQNKSGAASFLQKDCGTTIDQDPELEVRNGGLAPENENQNDADTSQIFVEVVPNAEKTRHLSQERQRLSSARSQVSSGVSDHSLSSNEKQQSKSASISRRPISFEFGLSPMSSSQDGGDNSAFVSPREDQPATISITPTTPPSTAYYVNVDPTTQGVPQYQLYQNKLLAGARRGPGRTQSLGSGSSNISDHHLHHFSDSSADHSYVNALQINASSESLSPRINLKKPQGVEKPSIEPGPLDYVTIDVGRGDPKRMTGHSTWASSVPSSLYKRYHKRQSSHGWLPSSASSSNVVGGGRNLSSVAEVANHQVPRKLSNQERGNGFNAENGTDVDDLTPALTTKAATNYARIDCTRTKALRETAAAAQMQRRSTSCSASSSETTETAVSNQSVGRKKHMNGLGFGRKKHHSGDLVR